MKPKMFILTQLFFNKTGNQSFYESVKGYLKEFDVYIISTANLKNPYYYSLEEISQKIPESKFILPRLRFYNFAREYRLVKNHVNKINNEDSLINSLSKELQENNLLINQKIDLKTMISFYYEGYILYKETEKLIRTGIKPDFLCSYGSCGVLPSLHIKRRNPSIKIFSKFQGTELGPVLNRIEQKNIQKRFLFQYKAMKKIRHFDGVIMTNDGTNGDKVLEYFNARKILFLPNGIATDFVNEVQQRNYRKDGIPENKDKIKLYTLSRVIPWKRVHLSVEIMNVLVNIYKNKKYELNIYGKADDKYLLYINNLIKKYSLENFIKIHGPVEYDTVAKIHYDNDILLSLYTTTNATNPVYEAIYIRNIVITLRDNNLDNILKSNPFVVYFENDPEEQRISEKIGTYLNKFSLRDYYINCFRKNKIIDDVFPWEERIRKEIEFIKTL